jgi:hypothetical protein
MTKQEADILIAGIERVLSASRTKGEAAQVLVAQGNGPSRWQYSCPYCNAHGDFLPLDHEASCPYS